MAIPDPRSRPVRFPLMPDAERWMFTISTVGVAPSLLGIRNPMGSWPIVSVGARLQVWALIVMSA